MSEAVLASNVKFTVSAADKVAELIEEEQKPDLKLRIYVTGGGCSGFQYGFTFDKDQALDDTVVEQACSDSNARVKLLIDSMSIQYLKEAEIDYVKEIQGERFVIRNPNAKTTCGCGSSFSVEEDDDD
ncbi:MAG: iron-sulfur cluster insertion protein ErpA [Gammaproteobacteria bacterium]|nr:iron-sulfur cluster insertion protein ErpA [Gammaproteobacteria bacterium]